MQNPLNSQPDQYWASLDPEELAGEVETRVRDYHRFLDSSGLLRKFSKAYHTYYGNTTSSYFSSSSDVGQGGEQGELLTVKVNHFRSLLQHLLVMTTSSRPSLEARATNTDKKSKAQTILANGILDYYMRDKRLERFLKTAVEHALLWGEGYIDIEWDTSLGQPYGVDPTTGKVVTEGDVRYYNPMGPLDVVRDVKLRSIDKENWKIVTEWVNKYDLAAKYPEKADDILKAHASLSDNTYQALFTVNYEKDGDLIPLRKFMHRRTDAMPDGRLFLCVNSDCWLFDGPFPYQNLPNGLSLFRITPGDLFGTPFGYSSAWDLIGLSEIHDALYSVVVTNQVSFGVQNVLVPKGHDISYQQLTGGLNLIEFDPKLGEPKPLNLTHTPPEIFNFINKIENVEGLLLGINDVVRGDPQASLKSGAALALVASQAIQFNSGLQASYIALLEDVGTATIRLLQTFANTKRTASIAGKAQRFMLTDFTSEDIQQVNRFVVDVSNPLSRTISGRLEMAKDILQIPGIITHPDQYLQIIETGSFESLTKGPEDQLLTIDSENEMLQDGQKPLALLTDNHKLHIQEHATVLTMPDARLDPAVVAAVTEHMTEHANILGSPDPNVQRILVITGQQPLPPPPPPQGPPGPGPQGPMPPKPPGPVPPPGGASTANMGAVAGPPVNPAMAQAQGVKMPLMPQVPGAPGERFPAPPSPIPPPVK